MKSRTAFVLLMLFLLAAPVSGDHIEPPWDVPVAGEHWEAIHWAVTENLMTGWPDGSWRPGRLVTDRQVEVVMKRAKENLGIDTAWRPLPGLSRQQFATELKYTLVDILDTPAEEPEPADGTAPATTTGAAPVYPTTTTAAAAAGSVAVTEPVVFHPRVLQTLHDVRVTLFVPARPQQVLFDVTTEVWATPSVWHQPRWEKARRGSGRWVVAAANRWVRESRNVEHWPGRPFTQVRMTVQQITADREDVGEPKVEVRPVRPDGSRTKPVLTFTPKGGTGREVKVCENRGTVTITATLSKPWPQPVKADWIATGHRVVPTRGEIEFPPGWQRAVFQVAIPDNDIVDVFPENIAELPAHIVPRADWSVTIWSPYAAFEEGRSARGWFWTADDEPTGQCRDRLN